MGVDPISIALIGLSVLSAGSKMAAAKDQAKELRRNTEAQAEAKRKEGELAASEKSKQIRQKAASQTSSFLTSGITLEGTPMDVLGETFTTGLADIDNIRSGYNTSIDNTVRSGNSQIKGLLSSARAEAISDIAGSFAGQSLAKSAGGMFDTALSYAPESALYDLNSAGFGNTAFKALELKDAR